VAARYGRGQKQKHRSEIARQKRTIETRDDTIRQLKTRLVAAHAGMEALVKNTPDTEWAAILGGMDSSDAKKLLVSLMKHPTPPGDPEVRTAWNRAMGCSWRGP